MGLMGALVARLWWGKRIDGAKAEQLYRILEFAKHLKVTILTLLRLDRATATEVAQGTVKARSVESAYLNQPSVMKIVRKDKENRKAVFSIILEALDW
jgi:hypothetical protein